MQGLIYNILISRMKGHQQKYIDFYIFLKSKLYNRFIHYSIEVGLNL